MSELFDLLEINKVKIVILIDEYDAQLAANINNPELYECFRTAIREFYCVIKDELLIKFIGITGVTRLKDVSVFRSGLIFMMPAMMLTLLRLQGLPVKRSGNTTLITLILLYLLRRALLKRMSLKSSVKSFSAGLQKTITVTVSMRLTRQKFSPRGR